MRALRCIAAAAIGAALAFTAILVARDGGCDRTPPDDDEPVPADCKPGDKTCLGAAGTSGTGG